MLAESGTAARTAGTARAAAAGTVKTSSQCGNVLFALLRNNKLLNNYNNNNNNNNDNNDDNNNKEKNVNDDDNDSSSAPEKQKEDRGYISKACLLTAHWPCSP
jgi:hypothetical protein